MTAARRYLTPNAYLRNSGYHEATLRVSPADPASVLDPLHYIELARTAERGVLDSIFPPDSPAMAEFLPGAGFDPLQLLSSVATETGQVGLITTVSTTHSYPRDMARCRATRDFLSHGRAGWNFVTTAEPAAARAEYAGRTLREHTGLPRPARSAAPFLRTGDSTTQGGEKSKATTAASPAGGPR